MEKNGQLLESNPRPLGQAFIIVVIMLPLFRYKTQLLVPVPLIQLINYVTGWRKKEAFHCTWANVELVVGHLQEEVGRLGRRLRDDAPLP